MSDSSDRSTVVVAAPSVRKINRRRGRKPARVTLHGVALHPDIARVVERVLTELQTDDTVSAGVVRAIQGLLAGPSTYTGKLDATHHYRLLLNAIIRELRKGTIDINLAEALRRAIKDGHDMTHVEAVEKKVDAIKEDLAALRARPDAPAFCAQLDAIAFAAADLRGSRAKENSP